MHGRGHAWRGHALQGGHVWQGGSAWQGTCVAGGPCVVGGHAWQGACVAGGMHDRGCMAGGHAWQIPRDTVNERAVRLLLECILVSLMCSLPKLFGLLFSDCFRS